MDLEGAREEELRDLVGRLDRLLPKDGAHLTIPADPDGNTTAGSRLGYLRFGLEFLMAALDPQPAKGEAPMRIVPRLDYVLTEGSRTPFDLCELDESISARAPVRSGLGLAGHLLAGILVMVVLIVLLVGVSVIWRWIFG